jgi:flagellin
MALGIQTNLASLQGQINVGKSTVALQASFAKLSSGLRVTSAADDAAGLAISENMKAQIRSYAVAQRNAADGISMSQTAEGALGQVHDILGRMRELAMQASNGTLGANQSTVDQEFQQLKNEIGRIQDSTQFNGTKLIAFDSQAPGANVANPSSVSLQVGLGGSVGAGASDTLTVSFNGVNLTALTGTYTAGTAINTGGGSLGTTGQAVAALALIDQAIKTVSDSRATYGAAMNRLNYAVNTIQTMSTNLTAANGRIVDVDVASESAVMSKNQVLSQAGISILAQANQLPQLAFGLLK